MALSQTLQQKLLQKLSPQQIQLMKLLQIPTANLDERIKEELEENPALEVSEENHEENGSDTQDEYSNTEDDLDVNSSTDDYENIDLSEYVSDGDDDVADYKTRDDNYPELDDKKVVPFKIESSFHEVLLNQLGLLSFDEKNYKIAEQIVGSIDDDGYLRRELSSIADDLAFRQNVIADESEIESVIQKIQQFDPPGICARNLQECLLIQLKRQLNDGKNVALAIEILDRYFEEFTKKHYEKIQRAKFCLYKFTVSNAAHG